MAVCGENVAVLVKDKERNNLLSEILDCLVVSKQKLALVFEQPMAAVLQLGGCGRQSGLDNSIKAANGLDLKT
eukprot:3377582-Amphidinium_carterae.1